MTTIKRFLIVVSVLTLVLNQVFAERVSQEDAAAVANNFMNAGTTQSGVRKSIGKRLVLKNTAAAAENQYYIYENADGEGWVMVAANDVVKPILAYSRTGTFNTDKMPSNVSHWLGHYDKFIKKLETEGVTQTEEVAEQWKRLRKAPPSTPAGTIVVGPLIQTTWDQTAPYNNLCPGTGTYENGGSKAATGCVATAMAQVMNYWQWPITGNGSRTYQPKDPNSETTPKETSKRYGQQTADFGSTTYDWANMKNSYSGTSTSAQKTAVATLMFHCGVATDMMYGNNADGGSGTYTVNYNDWDWDDDEGECAQNAFVMFFRYKKSGLTGYIRDGNGGYPYSSWTDAAWTNMIKTELDKQHPIMYGGSGSAGGHSFICDGYDDQNYFHFNWGWSGQNDGWFTLSNLVPGSGGAGGGGYNFSQDQDAIIGIVPDKPDVTIKWNVQGTETSQTVSYGASLVPPVSPSDCAGTGGKKFVGWTEQSSISNGARPSDLFMSGSGITVTENKTYYAVYATASGSGGSSTFSQASSIAVGDEVVLVYETGKMELSSFSSTSTVYGIGSSYSTTPSGSYSFNVVSGSSAGTFAFERDGKYWNWSSGNSLNTSASISESSSWTVSFNSGNAIIANAGTSSRTIRWNTSSPRFACYTSGQADVQLYKKSGGTSYSNYSLTCGAPVVCALTGITLNTSGATTTFTTGDAFSSAGLVVTAHYSNCADATVTPTSISSPDMSTAGSKTITVSYTENGTTKTATYTITVSNPVIHTVTWSVNGTPTSVVYTDGQALALPATPSDCSGEGGKKFVGWTASSSVSGSAPADLFTEASGTVTADATYYAVYATASGSGTPSSATYTFSNKSWNASPSNWTSGKDGAGFINNGVQVTMGATGANATCPTPYSDISSIVVSYCTNGNSGAGSITMAIGSITLAESVTKMGGTTARDLTFDFSSSTPSGAPKITVTCTTNSIYVCGLTINYGGGGTSYSDYSLTCGAPVVCALTGITLNTSGATTTFTTGDAFSSEGLVVTANYSNCADAEVTPTSISSPDMSTAGQKTITVSYTENNTTETATYTITVSDPVTHTVTWSVQGNTSTTSFADGAPLVVPSPQPSDCPGTDGKIFVGWTAHSTVDGSEPDDLFLVPGTKTVTADITYYAVYADYDVTSGGGAFDGDTEGYYKIYAEVGGTKYYATGTVSNGKMSGTTNEADAPEYTFTKVSGGWTIQNGTTYITYSGSTNLGTSTSAYTWTLSEGSHGSWRVASGTNSSRAWIYRAGSVNKFGGYSTSNVNGTEYFDLEIGGGSSSVITYSDYSLTCTDTPPGTTYTVTWKACGEVFKSETYAEGAALVLPDPAPEDNAGKSFYGWTETEHHTGASAPADAFTTAGSKTVTSDVTYYAIYY